MTIRFPNNNTRAYDHHSEGANATNPEPTHAAGGQGHQAPVAAVAPLAQRQPLAKQPNRAARRGQEHQQKHNGLSRVGIAINLYHEIAKKTQGESKLVKYQSLLPRLNELIREVDELRPVLKQKIQIDNKFLSELLLCRAQARMFISNNTGAMVRFQDCFSNHINSIGTSGPSYDSPELELLEVSNEIVTEASENLNDLRRAIDLLPDEAQSMRDEQNLNMALAITTKAILAIMQPMTLCTDPCFERVIGEQAQSFIGQEQLCALAMTPLWMDNTTLCSDQCVNQMRPILMDVATVCLDLVAFAVAITLPEPSTECSSLDIEQARSRIESSLRHCTELAHFIEQWQQIHPVTGVEKPLAARRQSGDLRVGDFVSVLAPSGMHVPAKIQTDGRATLLGKDSLKFEKRDGEFHLIEDADLEEDALTVMTDASQPQFQKLTKAVEKAEGLLARDVRTEARHLTACKGLNNPDLVMAAYKMQAERWQKQAEQMNKAAVRLDGLYRASNTPDENRNQLSDLAGRLRKEATTLQAKAQELTSPQTRWSLIKAYARPQASQLAELLAAEQVSEVGRPKPLPTGEQIKPIFEVEIRFREDADGTSYAPVWLHLHAKKQISAKYVRDYAQAQDFEAVHLKSNVEAVNKSIFQQPVSMFSGH